MNENTRLALIAFINAVEDLANALAPLRYDARFENVLLRGEQLKKQLNSDETIL